MHNNPYPDESASARPQVKGPAPVERMEDLPPRPARPVVQSAPEEAAVEAENIETHQEDALTVITVKYAIGKLNDFLQWFMAVLEVVLFIRFLLKLIGADPTNLFAGFLYALTDIVLFPFSTIVRSPSIHTNQAFEWSTLIAMAIYWLLFWAVRRFLRILISSPEEATT